MKSNIQHSKSKILNFLTCAGLFLLALLPRAYDLPRFVTADEAKWVYRSARFLAAFLQGDFPATSVNLTPAVTTTWLGSLGLAVYYQLHQARLALPLGDWLLSLPEFRVELDVLVAARWPMVILTSLGIVALYLLACRLFEPGLAFLAAVFLALDPHPVALSRVLGHDAPTALFMALALLFLLVATRPAFSSPVKAGRPGPWPVRLLPLGLSGLAAGLAFSSKAPAFFLVPFAVLLLAGRAWFNRTGFRAAGLALAVWLAVAWLTFVAVWPAAWVEPLGRPLAVLENAFLSATDQEEAEAESYWLVPDLGPAYYLVNGGLKLSPLVLAGAALAALPLWRLNRRPATERADEGQTQAVVWLLLFVLFFTIFMTVSDKRSNRYILPVFPPLAIVAAFGWLQLYRLRFALLPAPLGLFLAGQTLAALIILLPAAPYYFSYFNPLLGGTYAASNLVKIGWGEGLDQVGRYLQREAGADSRVGTAYASTVAPYFGGSLAGVTAEELDYLVLYLKQVQSGEPSPSFIRYFEQVGPIFSARLNGLRYADVYPGPALQPALALTPGLDHGILPQPTAFRPLAAYGSIGQPLEVDVLWLADDPLPLDPSTVTLEPLAAFDFLNEDNDSNGTPRVSQSTPVLAAGPGSLTRPAPDLVVSRHRLLLPAGLARGRYALLVDGRPLGEIELRQFQIPDLLQPVEETVFGQQIALAAYRFEPVADYIGLTVAWQARAGHLPDYTVFVQLIEAETNRRVAGVDVPTGQGNWPTSRWVKNEVVVDEYLVAVPPGLAPGFYKVIAGLYRPETGQRLLTTGGQDTWTVPWVFQWKGDAASAANPK